MMMMMMMHSQWEYGLIVYDAPLPPLVTWHYFDKDRRRSSPMTIARSRDSQTNNVQLSHNIFHVEIYSIATPSERDSRKFAMPMLINRATLGPKRAALAGAVCLLLVFFLWSRTDGPSPRLPLSSDRLISVSPWKLKFGRLLLLAIADWIVETGSIVPRV
jgi:hypothetical protein